MFVLSRDGSYRWQNGLGAAQEAVVTTSASSEPAWLERINKFLDSPVVAATKPPDVEKASSIDWVFWAKTAGIAGAVVFGFLWLTRVRV